MTGGAFRLNFEPGGARGLRRPGYPPSRRTRSFASSPCGEFACSKPLNRFTCPPGCARSTRPLVRFVNF